VVSATTGCFTVENDLVRIVQETGCDTGLVWRGAENLTPTGIRTPNLPACRESLY